MAWNRKRSVSFQVTAREIKYPRLDDDDDTESVHSVLLNDVDQSSDTSEDSEMTEYEVPHTPPDLRNPFFSTDDSDEVEEINEIVQLGLLATYHHVRGLSGSDSVGQLADTSTAPSTSPTSNSDVDPELPRLDYLDFWTCSQCKEINDNRHVPFCGSCYQMRKSFFPPRPRKRKGNKKKIDKDKASVTRNVSSSSKDKNGDVADGPSSIVRQDSCGSGSLTSTTSESGIEISNSNDFDVVDGPIAGPSKPIAEKTDSCQICLAHSADGLFYHGRTAHQYACYNCAKETWRKLGHCPLCRKKIIKVLKLR